MEFRVALTVLESEKISPDEIYLLTCIYSKRKPINIFTNKCQKSLINKGLINQKLEILEKGKNILVKFNLVETPVSKDNVDFYRELFPKGHLPSGVPARQNKKSLENAFKWFFKNYDYSWDVVIKATIHYVSYYEKSDYKYMRNSQYFIRKTNPDKTVDSELATYCEIILNGIEDTGQDYFKDKVV